MCKVPSSHSRNLNLIFSDRENVAADTRSDAINQSSGSCQLGFVSLAHRLGRACLAWKAGNLGAKGKSLEKTHHLRISGQQISAGDGPSLNHFLPLPRRSHHCILFICLCPNWDLIHHGDNIRIEIVYSFVERLFLVPDYLN